jgi:GTP-binding protein HflX
LHARDYSKGIKRRDQAKRVERQEKREKELEDPTVVLKEPEEIKPPWQAERWSEVRLLVLHPVTESARYSHADFLLSEAVGLAEACGWKVLDALKVPLHQTNSATYFGTGKVEELGRLVVQSNVNVVFIDSFLHPAQLSKLAQRWSAPLGKELRVLDRFAVILEIFSIRAHSRESKLQVELAWIEYQRSHLVGKHALEFKGEKQRGGRGFTAGSGETQLEIDRRRLSDRAAHV